MVRNRKPSRWQVKITYNPDSPGYKWHGSLIETEYRWYGPYVRTYRGTYATSREDAILYAQNTLESVLEARNPKIPAEEYIDLIPERE